MNALILHYHLQPFEMPSLLSLLVFAISFHYPINSQVLFSKLIAIHLFLMVLCILWNKGSDLQLVEMGTAQAELRNTLMSTVLDFFLPSEDKTKRCQLFFHGE